MKSRGDHKRGHYLKGGTLPKRGHTNLFQRNINSAAKRTSPCCRAQSDDFRELSCDLLSRFPTESVSFLDHDFDEKKQYFMCSKA